jgi:hypothetical protein
MNSSRIVDFARRALSMLDTVKRTQRQQSAGQRETTGPKPPRSRKSPKSPKPSPPPGSNRTGSAPSSTAASTDSELAGASIEYSPALDGDPDPGEVVWTWVPYEDDPSQGKDRPVVIFGRRGALLVGVALTSKQHDNEPQIAVGTGPWDRDGRVSYAKLERVLDLDPDAVRREGAILPKARFDELVAALEALHRPDRRDR